MSEAQLPEYIRRTEDNAQFEAYRLWSRLNDQISWKPIVTARDGYWDWRVKHKFGFTLTAHGDAYSCNGSSRTFGIEGRSSSPNQAIRLYLMKCAEELARVTNEYAEIVQALTY